MPWLRKRFLVTLVRTQPDEGDLNRCSVCTYESEDIMKVKRHRDSHWVGHCPNFDGYFLQKSPSYHIKKCSKVETHKRNKCVYTSTHKWMVERHSRKVHSQPHPWDECEKSFKTPELLESHMKSHRQCTCTLCGQTFNKMSKYYNIEKVNVNPTTTMSIGFMKLAGLTLGDKYKQGWKFHHCRYCLYKVSKRTHFQHHQRTHLNSAKKVRPDRSVTSWHLVWFICNFYCLICCYAALSVLFAHAPNTQRSLVTFILLFKSK